MKVTYALQPIADMPSIFLVGPTPRSSSVMSWRPEAIQILRDFGFTGQVLVPEQKVWQSDYLGQVEWEHAGLELASKKGCIAAWVPRDLESMPAFTTNVEFGLYVKCGRFAYGRPDFAPKNRYLDWLYDKTLGLKPFSELKPLLEFSIYMALLPDQF